MRCSAHHISLLQLRTEHAMYSFFCNALHPIMRPGLSSCMVRMLLLKTTLSDLFSAHPPLSLPIPQHHLEITPVRILATDLPWCYRSPVEKGFVGCRQLPPCNRDHPLVSSNHGDGLGAQQDCCDLHCPKDSPGHGMN